MANPIGRPRIVAVALKTYAGCQLRYPNARDGLKREVTCLPPKRGIAAGVVIGPDAHGVEIDPVVAWPSR